MSIAGVVALALLYILGVAGFILAHEDGQAGNLGGCAVYALSGLMTHLLVLWSVLEVT